MISRNSRRTAAPVENLRQGSIAAVKGVDETASILASDSALYTENLIVDDDGGLILRKPIVCIEDIPELVVNGERVPTELAYVGYVFNNEHKLVVRVSDDNTCYFGIFKNGVAVPVRLCWRAWDTFTEYTCLLSSEGDFY